MDGKLIHVSGRVQHLYPSDGGHITVENVSYVEGIETKVVEFVECHSRICSKLFSYFISLFGSHMSVRNLSLW